MGLSITVLEIFLFATFGIFILQQIFLIQLYAKESQLLSIASLLEKSNLIFKDFFIKGRIYLTKVEYMYIQRNHFKRGSKMQEELFQKIIDMDEEGALKLAKNFLDKGGFKK